MFFLFLAINPPANPKKDLPVRARVKLFGSGEGEQPPLAFRIDGFGE
jgi:hypothetical protein